MSTISEQEFIKLCDDIYRDRLQVYSYNPNVSRREAVLWMLLGCLLSLLSVPILDQPSTHGESTADFYADAIGEVLQHRMQPEFDPHVLIAELLARVEAN